MICRLIPRRLREHVRRVKRRRRELRAVELGSRHRRRRSSPRRSAPRAPSASRRRRCPRACRYGTEHAKALCRSPIAFMPIHCDVSSSVAERLRQRFADALDRRVRACAAHSLATASIFLPDARRRRAHVAQQFAADQIERLNAGRAFVNRDDAHVAILLRDAGLFDVAHSAEDLQRGRAELDGALRAPALDDRNHQLDERLVLLAHLLVGMALRVVERSGGDVGERAHRFDRRLLRHQHAPHVGMLDDRLRRCASRGLRSRPCTRSLAYSSAL